MRKYTPLMCKDCPKEIFVNENMVMIKDELWLKIADKKEDALCDCCMEKRLGREITPKDFKKSSMGMDMIPCNSAWLWNKQFKCTVCGCSEYNSTKETGLWKACKDCGTI